MVSYKGALALNGIPRSCTRNIGVGLDLKQKKFLLAVLAVLAVHGVEHEGVNISAPIMCLWFL